MVCAVCRLVIGMILSMFSLHASGKCASSFPALRDGPAAIKCPAMNAPTETQRKMSFASRLVAAREARGLSQAQLARAIGVTPQRLYLWESGQTLPNSITLLQELTDSLGITLDWLFLGRAAGLHPDAYQRLVGGTKPKPPKV